MIKFHNASLKTSTFLNRLASEVNRAMYRYADHHAESAFGKFTIFVGHEEFVMMCTVDRRDVYGMGEGDVFMSQQVVHVMKESYFKIVANEHLRG